MNNFGGGVTHASPVHHYLNTQGVQVIGKVPHVVVRHGEALLTHRRVRSAVLASLKGCKLAQGLRQCDKRRRVQS